MNTLNALAKSTLLVIITMITFSACENVLEQQTFDRINPDEFPQSESDARAFVVSSYSAMGDFFAADPRQTVLQAGFMSGHLVQGTPQNNSNWRRMEELDLSVDMGNLARPYNRAMPKVTMIAVKIDKISNAEEISENAKELFIAELRGLRAFYSHQLYNLYGPVPIITDPERAADPSAEPIPRPSNEAMINQIVSDYQAAIDALPARWTGNDYGRFSSTAAYMGLMKLYMHEKNWEKAIEMGNIIQDQGYSLVENYNDNFTLEHIGGNSEIIHAIPTRLFSDPSTTTNPNTNSWHILALTTNFRGHPDPDINYVEGMDQWEWFAMPWDMYDKFSPGDERTKRLFEKWIGPDGELFDGRANNYVGAIPLKYGIDPETTGEANRVNIIIWRYADVLLLQAEAINEVDGPTAEAYSLVNTVRNRAEIGDFPADLSQEEFRQAIMDERFRELWAEGTARNDMIRWGTFIQRAIDDGSQFAKPEFTLYPLPRQVINESNGVIEQNPGYN